MPKLEQIPYDKRLRDLYLKQGKIKAEEVEKYLKGLPDEANQAEELAVYEEEGAEASTESTEEN